MCQASTSMLNSPWLPRPHTHTHTHTHTPKHTHKHKHKHKHTNLLTAQILHWKQRQSRRLAVESRRRTTSRLRFTLRLRISIPRRPALTAPLTALPPNQPIIPITRQNPIDTIPPAPSPSPPCGTHVNRLSLPWRSRRGVVEEKQQQQTRKNENKLLAVVG